MKCGQAPARADIVVSGSCDRSGAPRVTAVELLGMSRRNKEFPHDELAKVPRRRSGDRCGRGPGSSPISSAAVSVPAAVPISAAELSAAELSAAGLSGLSAAKLRLQPGLQRQNPIGQIIDQLLGNRYNVTDRQAVSQCASAAMRQSAAQYGNGYNQGYNQGYAPDARAMVTTAAGDCDHRRPAPLERAARLRHAELRRPATAAVRL